MLRLLVEDRQLGPIYLFHLYLDQRMMETKAMDKLVRHILRQRRHWGTYTSQELSRHQTGVREEARKILRKAKDDFELTNGYLYRKVYNKTHRSWELRICVPSGGLEKFHVPLVGLTRLTVRKALLYHYHDGPLGNEPQCLRCTV